jgi:hypothetical protein
MALMGVILRDARILLRNHGKYVKEQRTAMPLQDYLLFPEYEEGTIREER